MHITPPFRLLSVFTFFSVATVALADSELSDDFNPVQTAVVSQSIASDGRSSGMGDIGAATEPDVYSQAWNPAKYPFTVSRAGFALSYTPWLRQLTEGIALINAAGYYRLGDYQALSASVRYFTLGDVYVGDSEQIVNPYEFGIDVAYSRMLSEQFSASVALRYMYSDLSGHYSDDVTAGSAFAADVAMYWNKYLFLGQRECNLAWGLNISNIGSKINYGSDYSYFIPTNLRFGLNLSVPLNEYNRFSVSAEANKLLVPSRPLRLDGELDEDYQERIREKYYDMSPITGIVKSFYDSERGTKGELEEIQWSVGGEYCYNDKFFLRAGYHNESAMQGNRKYATFGAGFKMNVLAIDASYCCATTAGNPLDQTLRVSLAFDFDGIQELMGRRGRRR